MFNNLLELKKEIDISKIEQIQEIKLNEKLKEELSKLFSEEEKGFVKINDCTSIIKTDKNYVFFSNQYFYLAILCKNYAEALYSYCNFFDEKIRNSNELSQIVLKQDFTNKKYIELFENKNDEELFTKFLRGEDYRPGKKFINGNEEKSFRGTKDLFSSCILKMLPLPDASSGYFGSIVYYLSKRKDLFDELENFYREEDKKEQYSISYFYNRIIFGAPGTGKSFRLKKESTENSFFTEITRVTFHPDYSYSQFVGTYKPTMIKADNKQEDENTKQIIQILQDKTSSSQKKYDILYDKFKENNLTLLPFLLGLYTDDAFSTRKKDGSATADDNNAERNHGKAIRSYVNLKSKNDGEEISYKYIPGPFLRTLVNALKSNRLNETKNYLLIIEEINRARVSAVFGDMFQLLDRNEDGESEYEIQTSEDMRNFLTEQLGGNKDDYQTIRLPNNFYIWATMNSADQGVFPMDTAFKRRWNFEYIGIDENEISVSAYEIPISRIVDKKKIIKKVNWNALRQAINKKLISLNVNEDKLLGPYFIGKKDLEDAMQNQENFIKLFKSKVLMYLFEDAAKMKRNFFNCDKYIYSEICKEFDEKGIEVFSFSDDEKGDLKELDIVPNPENSEPASE